MATVTDNSFVSKAKPPSASMDYALLRADGLTYIQQIAAGSWTDHNIHDPGITILENLVYAITDLGARANKPIEDLLVTEQQPVNEKDFFRAEEILPSSAVTISDYRKLLIDLDSIRNAWLYKSTSSEQQIYLDRAAKTLSYNTGESLVLNGLYNVLLEFEEDEALGDLNSSIVGADIQILVGGNPIQHTIEVAFPFWDEISSAWTQDIIINNITLQDVPGMPGKKLRALQTGIDYIFFTVMEITFNGTQVNQIGVTIQLTSAMQDATTELPLVEASIISKLQETTGNSITKAYNFKIIAANNILNTVKTYLYDNRNLCEDFFAFNATRVQEIGVNAKLQLAPDTNAEQALAEMFYQLDQFFSPPIHFYTLEEMLAMGKTVSEIYDGPLLKHGFILDEDLIELKREDVVYTSDLIRVIMNLNGSIDGMQPVYSGQNKKIISVNNLTIANYINNQAINTNIRNCLRLTLIDIYKPKLSIGKSAVTVIKDNVEISYDEGKVVDIFKAMKAQQAIQNLAPVATSVLSIPTGNYLAVDAYYSIQNDFPKTYGISYTGLPNTATEERKAQAKQLKAFLLFFEQLLANYLSQLGHIKELFSIDAGVNDTYFWQPLSAVPNVEPLLKSTYTAAIPELLKKLEQTSSGISRRSNFLDHLLGQFGEDFTEFALLMYAKYGDAATPTLINDKAVFLKEYAEVSYNRAKSYNYTGAAWNTDNVAWIKKRISYLLGIETYQQQDLAGNTAEGFHIVEHILLRPKINDSSAGTVDAFLNVELDVEGNIIEGKKDPYSFKLSFVFPNWPARFTDPEFKRYIEKIIHRETPAHMLAEIYWLDEATMQAFELAFKAWLTAVATQADPASITPEKNALVAVLNSL